MLPQRFSAATLEKNLSALATLNTDLVQRLCLPVDGSHIRFSETEQILYRLNDTLLPSAVNVTESPDVIGDIEDAGCIMLFGIGLGEQLDLLLERFPGMVITVWDRDPWLLRLALMQRDYSQYMVAGRLKLSLGIDLLEMIGQAQSSSVMYHPLLKSIYRNERNLLESGTGGRRAMTCAGGLFIDDAGDALKDLGYSLYTLDIRKLAVEEIDLSIKRFAPRFLFAINYTNGLAELCRRTGIDLVCWEIDPATDRLKPCGSGEEVHVFTYRKRNVDRFRRAGFRNAEHLPLASNTGKRFPVRPSDPEKNSHSASLSFVGSSMLEQAESFRTIFLNYYRNFKGGAPQAWEEGNRRLEDVLYRQREDFSLYTIPDLLQEYFPGLDDHVLNLPEAYDPFILVGEIAAAEKRLNYLARLSQTNVSVKVWGDPGWKSIEPHGIKYMGYAGHHREINSIYANSLINIDVNRIYQMDIVPMRIFDILACGGFVLAEHSDELTELFKVGYEVEAYRTFDELTEKAAYYLGHRDEAQEIAGRGMAAVRSRHTINSRIEYMLRAIEK
ncbi:MAG: glycosyltransferase [Pseudomonadota bacterium]